MLPPTVVVSSVTRSVTCSGVSAPHVSATYSTSGAMAAAIRSAWDTSSARPYRDARAMLTLTARPLPLACPAMRTMSSNQSGWYTSRTSSRPAAAYAEKSNAVRSALGWIIAASTTPGWHAAAVAQFDRLDAQRGEHTRDPGEQVGRPVEVDLEAAVAQGHVDQPGQRFGGGRGKRGEVVEHQPSRRVATTAAAAWAGLSPACATHSRKCPGVPNPRPGAVRARPVTPGSVSLSGSGVRHHRYRPPADSTGTPSTSSCAATALRLRSISARIAVIQSRVASLPSRLAAACWASTLVQEAYEERNRVTSRTVSGPASRNPTLSPATPSHLEQESTTASRPGSKAGVSAADAGAGANVRYTSSETTATPASAAAAMIWFMPAWSTLAPVGLCG